MNHPVTYDPGIVLTDITAESARQLNICNACRYCEGFCPVFPAIAHHRWYTEDDTAQSNYLAHLCHNCSACYHACQYKPPHDYAITLPGLLSQVRTRSFAEYAWPESLGQSFTRNPLITSMSITLLLIVVLGLAFTVNGSSTMLGIHTGPGAFYNVISHAAIVASAGLSLGFATFAIAVAWRRFAQHIGLAPFSVRWHHWCTAVRDTLTLKHLGGGHGEGCNVADERFSNQRRIWHQVTAYGFALCFAATCTATVYELLLGRLSPFPLTSLPVMLGIVGGIGLICGPLGLLWLKRQSPSVVTDSDSRQLDTTLCVNLLLISITGFALMLVRETAAMGLLLGIHLAVVLAFFITLPYSKFVHAGYRFLALLKHHCESS